jgi:hypothetical protein
MLLGRDAARVVDDAPADSLAEAPAPTPVAG